MTRLRRIEFDGKSYKLPSNAVKKIKTTINESIIEMETDRWINHFRNHFDELFEEPKIYLKAHEMDKRNGWRVNE